MKRAVFIIISTCFLTLLGQDTKQDQYHYQKSRHREKFRFHRLDSRIPCNKKEIDRIKESPFINEQQRDRLNHNYDSPSDQHSQEYSSWRSVGPEGGNISGLVSNPQNRNELFASTRNYPAQVYKSADTGQTWTKLSYIYSYCYDLAMNPQDPNVLYALGNDEIYKTYN